MQPLNNTVDAPTAVAFMVDRRVKESAHAHESDDNLEAYEALYSVCGSSNHSALTLFINHTLLLIYTTKCTKYMQESRRHVAWLPEIWEVFFFPRSL